MKKSAHIVLKNGSRFLFHLRDNKRGIPFPNYWALIGGAIEKGEEPLEAIIREASEEICCNAVNIEFITTLSYYHSSNKTHYEVYLFKGNIKEKLSEITLTEGKKIKYFKLSDLNHLRFPAFLKKYILSNEEKFI